MCSARGLVTSSLLAPWHSCCYLLRVVRVSPHASTTVRVRPARTPVRRTRTFQHRGNSCTARLGKGNYFIRSHVRKLALFFYTAWNLRAFFLPSCLPVGRESQMIALCRGTELCSLWSVEQSREIFSVRRSAAMFYH